jgi:hypothetical protein
LTYGRSTVPVTGHVHASAAGDAASRRAKDEDDAVRIALGSVVADFLQGRTSSTYTPYNKALDSLIRRPAAEEKQD